MVYCLRVAGPEICLAVFGASCPRHLQMVVCAGNRLNLTIWGSQNMIKRPGFRDIGVAQDLRVWLESSYEFKKKHRSETH